jgi:hypothetical protein
MADWLKRVIDDVDRQFEALPEWRKSSAEQFLSFSSTNQEELSSSIREPDQQEREYQVS